MSTRCTVSTDSILVIKDFYPLGAAKYETEIVTVDKNLWSVAVIPPTLSKSFLDCTIKYCGVAPVKTKVSINFNAHDNHQTVKQRTTFSAIVDEKMGVSFTPTSKFTTTQWMQSKNKAVCQIGYYDMPFFTDWVFQISFEEVQQDVVVSAQNEMNSLAHNMSNMLCHAASADISIIVEGVRIPVHKMILYHRSPVFKVMLTSGLSESTSNEIMITDFSAEVVRAFIGFMYTDHCDTANLTAHSEQLLAIAHRYEVFGLLVVACENHMSSNLTKDNVLQYLLLASTYETPCLLQTCSAFLRKHKEVLRADGAFENVIQRLSGDAHRELMKYI